MGRLDSPNLQLLGRFVRERRRELNLTQTQLAERVGWVQERISLLENAKYGLPSLPALESLAGMLETQLPDLLRAAGFIAAVPPATMPDSENRSNTAYLRALQQLLAIEPDGLRGIWEQTADVLCDALGAEEIAIFLREPDTEILVSTGRSSTPMSRRRRKPGLHRIPIANGGRMVEVFLTGESFLTGDADRDAGHPAGDATKFGVRSLIAVALDVGSERRGVLAAESGGSDRFSEADVRFLIAVARWIGMIAHCAELGELLTQESAVSA